MEVKKHFVPLLSLVFHGHMPELCCVCLAVQKILFAKFWPTLGASLSHGANYLDINKKPDCRCCFKISSNTNRSVSTNKRSATEITVKNGTNCAWVLVRSAKVLTKKEVALQLTQNNAGLSFYFFKAPWTLFSSVRSSAYGILLWLPRTPVLAVLRACPA